jgi:quercetin dioxygenase-like cupin family protein
MKLQTPSRLHAFTGIAGGGVLVILLAGAHQDRLSAQQSNFMGGTPTRMPSDKISTLRLKFPAGSRSNWHSHTWGQLLMVEEGKGLTQVRGGPVQEVGPGQPWFTNGGIEHWHGAASDADMVQLTIYEGDVKWLEPVTDQQYRAPAQPMAPQR